MQNAVALTRVRSKTSGTTNTENNEGALDESYLQSKKRASLDDKKFQGFWEVVESGVLLNEQSKFAKGDGHQGHSLHISEDGMHKSFLVYPNGTLKILWDFIMSILVIYSVVYSTFAVGFNISPNYEDVLVDYIIIAFFSFDIIMNFNTAYLDESSEKYITDRKQIATFYLRFWFWFDLIATLPFDLIAGSGEDVVYVRVVRIIRLFRLFKLYKMLSTGFEIFSPAISSLLVLLLQIFLVAHVFACFWHYIATPSAAGELGKTWLTEFGFEHKSTVDKYVAAIYYVIVTMMTVGFGDIYPTNETERMYGILTMLTGGIIFGALVNQVTSLIDKRNPQAKAYKQKMDELKAFMEEVGLPVVLQKRLRSAYAFNLSKQRDSEMFQELPGPLLRDMICRLNEHNIEGIDLFTHDHVDKIFVAAAISKARPYQILEGETIFYQGDVCNDIMFVKTGVIHLLMIIGKKEICVGCIQAGNYFGDSEMYKNTTAIITYRAHSYCKLLAISHDHFQAALLESPKTRVTFDEIIKKRYENLVKVLKFDHTLPDINIIANKNASNTNSQQSDAKNALTDTQSVDVSPRRKGLSRAEAIRATHDTDTTQPLKKLQSKQSFIEVAEKRKNWEVHKEVYIDGLSCPSNGENRHLFMQESMHRNSKDSEKIRVIDISRAEEPRTVSMSELKQRYLLHPRGHYKVLWDFFVGMLILYSVLIVPVEIGFSENAYKQSTEVNYMIDSFFALDILFSFRTCYDSAQHDALVISGDLVLYNYLQTWFCIDIVSTVPVAVLVELFTSGGKSSKLAFTRLIKIFRLFRLLKMARILKLNTYLEIIEEAAGIHPSLFQLIALLIQVYFIAHWMSCIWWGLTNNFPAAKWYQDIGTSKLSSDYLLSVYYSFTIMTTVGYGDITSVSTWERLLTIFMLLVGASIFGYMIANVSALLNNFRAADALRKERITEILQVLSENNIAGDLKNKVVNHFQRTFKESSSFNVDAIVRRLPPMLEVQVLSFVYKKRMSLIPIFKYITNKSVAVYLFKLMKPIYYEEGEYIINEGSVANDLCFLVSGQARAFKRIRLASRKPKRPKSILRMTRLNSVDEQELLSDAALRSPGMQNMNPYDTIDFMTDPYDQRRSNNNNNNVKRRQSRLKKGQDDETNTSFSLAEEHRQINSTLGMSIDYFYDKNEPAIHLTRRAEDHMEESDKPPKKPKRVMINTTPSPAQSDVPIETASSEWSKSTAHSKRASIKEHFSKRFFPSQYSVRNDDGSSEEKEETKPEPTIDNSTESGLLNQRLAMFFSSGGDARKDDPLFSKSSKSFERMNARDFKKVGLQLIGNLYPGDFVGHVEFMHECPHKASVKATQPCTVYTLSAQMLTKLIRIEPTVALQLQSALIEAIALQSVSVAKAHMRNERAAFLKDIKKKFFDRRFMEENNTSASNSHSNAAKKNTAMHTNKNRSPGNTPRDGLENNSMGDTMNAGARPKLRRAGSYDSVTSNSSEQRKGENKLEQDPQDDDDVDSDIEVANNSVKHKLKALFFHQKRNKILKLGKELYDSDEEPPVQKQEAEKVNEKPSHTVGKYRDRSASKPPQYQSLSNADSGHIVEDNADDIVHATSFNEANIDTNATTSNLPPPRLEMTNIQMKRSRSRRIIAAILPIIADGLFGKESKKVQTRVRSHSTSEIIGSDKKIEQLKMEKYNLHVSGNITRRKAVKQQLKLVRRQSYPSLDNVRWRENKIKQGLV